MARGLSKLVDNVSENNNLKGVLADSMYDSYKSFRYLSRNHINSGIKTRSNSKVRSTNCHSRNMCVIRQQINLKRWKHSLSYRHRWMVKTVFSSIKRIFGEHVTARKFPNMVKEIFLKVALYNMFNRMF
jgi:Transposase DDE domain